MAKAKFYLPKDQGIIGVMGTLSQTLPDERPITAISVVENSSKCPEGFFPILKTYDEDCDADLWRQPVIFGKKSCRYLCLSKSENVSLYKMTALRVMPVGDTLPQGFSAVSITSDTNRPAWRRRQICCMLTNDLTILSREPLLTDIIVCSRLKKAPMGFQYAGEINGMLICYKTGTRSNDTFRIDNNLFNLDQSAVNYENVINKDLTPDANKRKAPVRPPKEPSLVSELNKLNLQNSDEATNNDYELLNPLYGLQPTRSAPPVPGAPPVPPRVLQSSKHHVSSTYSSYTLAGCNTLDGVLFILNPKLSGFSNYHVPIPNIKKKTLLELNKEYSYNFIAERQT
ncbi:multivesicular body subunit 12-like Mvb12 [Arctopsyche grandis]|uniref:multivesicular body subunit 12-like Mvb12 n=1 Tax=Arctopsyche grandis TaxID=121162 RepID=UPI00406D94AC